MIPKILEILIEDNIVKPASGLTRALVLVDLALGGYSQVIAHMPKKWSKNKLLHLIHKLL